MLNKYSLGLFFTLILSALPFGSHCLAEVAEFHCISDCGDFMKSFPGLFSLMIPVEAFVCILWFVFFPRWLIRYLNFRAIRRTDFEKGRVHFEKDLLLPYKIGGLTIFALSGGMPLLEHVILYASVSNIWSVSVTVAFNLFFLFAFLSFVWGFYLWTKWVFVGAFSLLILLSGIVLSMYYIGGVPLSNYLLIYMGLWVAILVFLLCLLVCAFLAFCWGQGVLKSCKKA